LEYKSGQPYMCDIASSVMGCGEAVLAWNRSVPHLFEQSKFFLIQLLFYKESLVHDRE
jgi:hypothetical protein